MGFEIDNLISRLTVDEENDSFLILTGSTNPNRDNVNLSYYVLCVKGTPITLVISTDHKGNAAKCNAEFNWIILYILNGSSKAVIGIRSCTIMVIPVRGQIDSL